MADPKIKYDIEANVKGDAEVGQLAGKLEALAKTLDGDLKTNANAAAAALRQLGDKQTAITRFVELKQGAQDAAAKLNDAQAAAQKMGQTLDTTEAPTRAQTGQMQKLGDAVRAAKADVLQQNLAVQQARSALQQYGVQTTGLSQTQAGLARTLGDAVKTASAYTASIDEMRESDRLLAIEAKTLAVEMEKGRVALLAENSAQLDVAAQTRKTAQAKAAATLAAKEAEAAWQKEAFAMVETAEAAQKAKRAADLLIEAERFLASETAKATLEQREAAAEQKRLADAATAASQKISDAFRAVGVRSAQELQAEIVDIRTAMETVRTTAGMTGNGIATAFATGETKIKALERDIREVNGTLTTGDKAAKLFSSSIGQISAGNIVANAVGFLANKTQELGSAFLGAIVQGDQLQRGLNAIYKDAGTTAAQIDFLRRSSRESGVAFGGLSAEFVKFSASMHAANIPLEQSNDLFRAVTASSAALGLGSDATAGALNALGQMASKGTVSMEELRQQLGDRLPGAMSLTAKGLGITEAQLIKLVESGGLATRDFIVPFTKALGEMKGEAEGLVPTWERLKGAMSETAQNAGDSGWTAVMTVGLKLVGGAVGLVVLPLTALSQLIFGITKSGAILAGAVLTWTRPWDALGKVWSDAASRQADLTASFDVVIGGGGKAAQSASDGAVALSANTAEVVKSINANTSLGNAQKLAALSSALASDAALDASAKIVQYGVAAAGLLKNQEAQTDAFNKSAKAAKQQGDTLVELAKLTGDVITLQNAEVEAATLNAAALDKVAKSQANETAMLVAQKSELLASTAARGIDAEKVKVQTDALEKLILKSQAETEQAAQASIAAKAALFERQLAIDKLKDHSAEIGSLKTAVESAAATLQEYEQLSLNGKKTDAEVTQAREALTRATALYKDGLSDAIRNLEAETRAKQASLQLSISQSSTAQKHAEVMAAQARSIGDVATATFYDIEAKEASIKTIKLQIQLASLEAEAARESIKLKLAELTGTDDLTASKRRILEVELEIIKVKLAGNDAAKETIKGIENEITALRNGTAAWGASTSGIGGNTGARSANTEVMQKQADALDLVAMKYKLSADYTEAQIALLERLTAATEKATAAENKRLNRDKEGFSLDTGDKRVNMTVNTQRSVYEDAKSQGLTEAQALRISNQFIDSLGRQIGGAQANTRAGENWGTELQKAIDKLVLANARDGTNGTDTPKAKATGPSAAENQQPATDTQALIADYERQLRDAKSRNDPGDIADLKADIARLKQSAPTTTVTINLNGNMQSVNTDAAGARVLQDILSQLGNAKATSSTR